MIEKLCIVCENKIPITKNKQAEYCSKKCQKKAYYLRNKSKKSSSFNTRYYRKLVVEFLGKKCFKCGGIDNLEIDHINDLSNGGKNTIENIQLLCKSCHTKKSKNTFPFSNFGKYGGGYQKAKGIS